MSQKYISQKDLLQDLRIELKLAPIKKTNKETIRFMKILFCRVCRKKGIYATVDEDGTVFGFSEQRNKFQLARDEEILGMFGIEQEDEK